MHRIAMLSFATLGATCIYAGYQLFCGLPALNGHLNGQGPRMTRAGVLLLNVVPGALLALLGTGILTAEVRGIVTHRPAFQRHIPAAEGTSWHPAKSGFLSGAA